MQSELNYYSKFETDPIDMLQVLYLLLIEYLMYWKLPLNNTNQGLRLNYQWSHPEYVM